MHRMIELQEGMTERRSKAIVVFEDHRRRSNCKIPLKTCPINCNQFNADIASSLFVVEHCALCTTTLGTYAQWWGPP